jgi:type I site-specific restriction-modification system R (restriction) subunit
MRNHTLMQTIARANRVWKDKQNGLILDYVGILRDLQKALAIYGTTQGDAKGDDLPIKDKQQLANLVRPIFRQPSGKIIQATSLESLIINDDAAGPFECLT